MLRCGQGFLRLLAISPQTNVGVPQRGRGIQARISSSVGEAANRAKLRMVTVSRLLCCLLLILAIGGGALAADLIGRASVIDGDTLEIHSTRIRLWGIDAPESSQFCRGSDSLPYRCGAKAANELDRFIAGRPVSCEPVSRDVYGRTV